MKIKKLELIGFKSFVDRTVLHFDHDVLGIVGPNGCGKSNIVDAIRWCMGEQSARHLRGRSMDDVIFSGSESRAGNEFAEVTLTFENDAPDAVPLEYRGYAEIAVTRRLHRSGESDYLINKTVVRLRDVTDMFLGTGAGTKAYSIVEQGKVGLIVSAKPEDRRLLIEEAAGITKFKSKKKQAEKKMEMTQQNLLRVGDIVAEIERNLASLKRQAAKAERFISYRNELEDLQLHDAAHRYLELVGWIKLERSEVDRAAVASEEVRVQLGERESEVEGARIEVQAAEERFETAQSTSIAADQEVRAGETEIARAKDRLASLSQREQQAQGEKEEMNGQLVQLAAERELLVGEIERLTNEERVRVAELAEGEAALGTQAELHRATDARVAALRQGIASHQAEIARGEAKLAAFERRHAEMIARRDKLHAECESLEAGRLEGEGRVANLTEIIENARRDRIGSAAERECLEARLKDLKERVRAEERTFEEAKGELSRKRSRHGALVELQARLEGVGAGTKALVGTRDAAIVGLVADRIEAPEELTAALAGLLGARLQDVVVRDLERGVALLEDLARRGKGRATIVPLRPAFVSGRGAHAERGQNTEDAPIRLADALRFASEDASLVEALVGDAQVVRDLNMARTLRASGVSSALVTRDGMVLHADGRLEGGQGDALAAGMLESKRETRMLFAEIERLDTVVTTGFEALSRSRAELSQAGAALDLARQEAHARELAFVGAEKDLQKGESQLEGVQRRIQSLLAEGADLSRVIDDADVERSHVEQSLLDARTLVATLEGELQEAAIALTEAREHLDVRRQRVTTDKVLCAATREKLAATKGAEVRLTRSVQELESRVTRLGEELSGNAHAFSDTEERLAVCREGLQVAIDRASEASAALSKERSTFEEVRSRLSICEAAMKPLRARVDALREELQTHEMALREREIALSHVLEGVRDKFRGLHLPRVVGDYHMRQPPDDASRARVEDLVRLLDRMGSVNLDAMREHAEAEERFTFYTTQKTDLEKALSDLQRAIQLMNRESRRLFEETFTAVNERFREIFPRMFRGGRAELRLTNPDDILETGIDIIAQPPGKKLSSIELMSGGEKALTAVSLIFAIFQIKPSPFCILDEVDAPLDEANVARYNELIRSMTDRSQFILITHIKRTMQMVDVLYGVTMPESGVSKIVSVRINETAARPQIAPESAVA